MKRKKKIKPHLPGRAFKIKYRDRALRFRDSRESDVFARYVGSLTRNK